MGDERGGSPEAWWENDEDDAESETAEDLGFPDEGDDFTKRLRDTLSDTAQQVISLHQTPAPAGGAPQMPETWEKSRLAVERFRPVPWFIWRVSNYVLARPGTVNKISEGMVFGLTKLLRQAASDKILGSGAPVKTLRKAVQVLPSDVIAAVSVIHSISRRLHAHPFERVWRPILDDALIRARMGFLVGQMEPAFGPGRGMLAGFSGRSGLAIMLAMGTEAEAQEALEALAHGKNIRQVGIQVWGCDPLQVSAMTLSGCGVGRDAAFGTVSFASEKSLDVVRNEFQLQWLAAYTVIEHVRMGSLDEVDPMLWNALGYMGEGEKDDLRELTKLIVRQGHNWTWML